MWIEDVADLIAETLIQAAVKRAHDRDAGWRAFVVGVPKPPLTARQLFKSRGKRTRASKREELGCEPMLVEP